MEVEDLAELLSDEDLQSEADDDTNKLEFEFVDYDEKDSAFIDTYFARNENDGPPSDMDIINDNENATDSESDIQRNNQETETIGENNTNDEQIDNNDNTDNSQIANFINDNQSETESENIETTNEITMTNDDDNNNENEKKTKEKESFDFSWHVWNVDTESKPESKYFQRTIIIDKMGCQWNEETILSHLFNDINPHWRPIDIRIFSQRIDSNDNSFAHLVFENSKICSNVCEILNNKLEYLKTHRFKQNNDLTIQRAKNDTYDIITDYYRSKTNDKKQKRRSFNKKYIQDSAESAESKENALKPLPHLSIDGTFRLIFCNLHYKSKSNDIFQFIKRNLNSNFKKYETLLKMSGFKQSDCFPMRIELIRDNLGFNTMVAYVDFEKPIYATFALIACHKEILHNRQILVDWIETPKQVCDWIATQAKYRTQMMIADSANSNNNNTIFLYNLPNTINNSNVITQFINKLIGKLKLKHILEIVHIRLCQNRATLIESHSHYCVGFAFVEFKSLTNNFGEYKQGLLKLRDLLQYRVMNQCCIQTMFVKDRKPTPLNDQLRGKTRYLLLNNLEWNVSERDIKIWIGSNVGSEIVECIESMEIHVDSDGYPLGSAMIQLKKPQFINQIIDHFQNIDSSNKNRQIECGFIKLKSFYLKGDINNHSLLLPNNLHFLLNNDLSDLEWKSLSDNLFGFHKTKSTIRIPTKKRKVDLSKFAIAKTNQFVIGIDSNNNINDKTKHNNNNNKRKRENENENENKNESENDILTKKDINRIQKIRRERLKLRALSKRMNIDESMLARIKQGQTIDSVKPTRKERNNYRPNKPGYTSEKKGVWNQLGMTFDHYRKIKTQIDWQTGKPVISRMIAKKNTIHKKNYWNDSVKFARRRTKSRWYIQKSANKSRDRK